MKRTLRPISFLPPLVFVASLAQAHGRPTIDAYYGSEGVSARGGLRAAAPARPEPRAGKAVVASVDPQRGVPAFLWAPSGAREARGAGATPEAAARGYLERYASLYELSGVDLGSARLASVHDTGKGGIIVTMKQQVGDVEVFRSDVKLLLNRGLDLVAISGSPYPAASRSASLLQRGGGFKLGREDALARAFGDMFGLSVGAEAFREAGTPRGAYRSYQVDPAVFGLGGVTMRSTPRAKPVYFPLADRLVPAYYLELDARNAADGDEEAFAYVIAADDGRVLYRANLIAYDAFSYKVFAEDDAARHYPPTDSPLEDHTPHPTGAPDDYKPGFIAQRTVTIEGFNKHADPWLPADATRTSGNNVNAYADHDAQPAPGGGTDINDGLTGDDPVAELTGDKAFAYTFDPQAEPTSSDEQTKAAITQLFYLTNWLHDYWYDSGFDEASGVAQNSNFGRVKDESGAVDASGEGDAIEAQAQDKFFAGSRNNANMSTPTDGGKPRMQMFVFNGRVAKELSTNAAGLPKVEGRDVAISEFGPQEYEVSAALALANDGVAGEPTTPGGPPGTATDGCEPFAANSLAGKIAVVDRGRCAFAEKALNAQGAGAVGVVIVNNSAARPVTMANPDALAVTIPGQMIRQAAGAKLKEALAAGEVTGTIKRQRTEKDYDGTIDNSIAAHEWGHYWHHRLVSCGSQQCGAMSEGWADFVALHMSVREGDDLSGAFAAASYASSASKNASYFGIRRYPYSTDRSKNPLSFRYVATKNALPIVGGPPINDEFVTENAAGETVLVNNNSETHNAGEVWASIFFDAYAKLLAAHPFEAAQRRMADYVVGGMKLAPVEPTFTEQRDAILAYVYNADDADYR
ncbi:MAG TPA: M36 family metallopeptidase, partial [Polyangiaceae bacterium]|nr:M36 family metallopeptidase [Polyangiaceae bacterium]